MRENRLRRIWDEGGKALNCWISSPPVLQAEMIAAQGFDSVVVDGQHGDIDARDMANIFTALATTDVVPMVRVPWNDPPSIMRALDMGAYGVMAPMINTRADAEKLVHWCRYPPEGERSFGPMRSALYAGASAVDYFGAANRTVLTIAQIETAEAMTNLDAILATPGLDVVYVGSADLSISHGGPATIDHVRQESVDWHLRILESAGRAGVDVALCIERGADLITVANDIAELTAGTAHKLAESRQLLSNGTAEQPAILSQGYGQPAA
jgi:4-hydroxy-2-oxoheptanedioate aldolase